MRDYSKCFEEDQTPNRSHSQKDKKKGVTLDSNLVNLKSNTMKNTVTKVMHSV